MSDNSKALGGRIRRMAERLGLCARKSRQDGLWYISEPNQNVLLSSEYGMDEQNALEWLQTASEEEAEEEEEAAAAGSGATSDNSKALGDKIHRMAKRFGLDDHRRAGRWYF